MGSGRWSTNVYDAAARFRAASGASAFAYSDGGATEVHPSLDPRGVTRRSLDSDEHPESLAITVLFDVTGSMRKVPRTLQTKLPQLLGLLLRHGYVQDPQLLFGAIGDATCDDAPLQIGQFESDNRMDDDLSRIWLEGGGGGQKTESLRTGCCIFMARHTPHRLLRKARQARLPVHHRRRNGLPEGESRRGARRHRRRTCRPPIPLTQILAQVQRKWDTYYILPEGSSYARDPQVLTFWSNLLGQNLIELSDLDAVCETIALTVGLGEAAIDLTDGLADLADVGSKAGGTVSRALATISKAQGTLVVAAPPADLNGGRPGGNNRL